MLLGTQLIETFLLQTNFVIDPNSTDAIAGVKDLIVQAYARCVSSNCVSLVNYEGELRHLYTHEQSLRGFYNVLYRSGLLGTTYPVANFSVPKLPKAKSLSTFDTIVFTWLATPLSSPFEYLRRLLPAVKSGTQKVALMLPLANASDIMLQALQSLNSTTTFVSKIFVGHSGVRDVCICSSPSPASSYRDPPGDVSTSSSSSFVLVRWVMHPLASVAATLPAAASVAHTPMKVCLRHKKLDALFSFG